MTRFLLRVLLVTLAIAYALPSVAGIQTDGNILGALASSTVFNLTFLGLEWLLGILVFSINIGTLGLGFIFTSGLKFMLGLISPTVALVGTAKLMPQFLHIADLFPGAMAGGLLLGGLLWSTVPQGKKK